MDESEPSYESMLKVGEIMDGKSVHDILSVFSWLLGDTIIQGGFDKDLVLVTFAAMTKSAIDILSRGKYHAQDGRVIH